MIDERVLLAWRDAIGTLSTLAWAGARNSTVGGQLLRDGWVGRLRCDSETAQCTVSQGDHGELVAITRKGAALTTDCSCGVPRCAHAVAVVLELQKRLRRAQTTSNDRGSVLANLRERLRPSTETPPPPRALRDLQRLPADAAVDMVALAWRQALRPTPSDVAELEIAVALVRTAVNANPEQAAVWALRLLDGLGAAKVVFTPLSESAQVQLEKICAILGVCQQPLQLQALFVHATDGQPEIAPAVAVILAQWAARDGPACDKLTALAQGWVESARHPAWREHAQPGGADLLLSALIDSLCAARNLPPKSPRTPISDASALPLAVARQGEVKPNGRGLRNQSCELISRATETAFAADEHRTGAPTQSCAESGESWAGGHLDRALRLAQSWPPLRSTLLPLMAAAAQAGSFDAIRQILGRLDVRGATFAEAATAAWQGAQTADQPETALAMALWVLERLPAAHWYQRARLTCPPQRWAAVRHNWLAAVLAHDEVPWLPAALADETDAAQALFAVVHMGPLRDQTATAALAALGHHDVQLAVAAHQLRFLALCTSAAPTDKAIVRAADDLCQIATTAGQPLAGAPYLRLVIGNHTGRLPLAKLLRACAEMPT